LDPFGGTGQTAMEAIKFGCTAITSDSNTIATMVSKVKFTYFTEHERRICLAITEAFLLSLVPVETPTFDRLYKWHHPKTIHELCLIKKLIEDSNNEKLKIFYTVCFSDILTSCTARKGKEHGFFADNTPLSKDDVSPQYENALKLFIAKIKKNIAVLEKSYIYFDKNGLDVSEELNNAKVFQNDITKSNAGDFNLQPGSIAGIITSPPYLCMADYTLGQRLSYEWLFPEKMSVDFKNEVGARRSRIQKEQALENYLNRMRLFAKTSCELLRKDGFLATVVGAPLATLYKEKNILIELDKIFLDEGLKLLWETNRPISWHRNHGYARLKEERIAVHIKM
jgi:hypothetical protein